MMGGKHAQVTAIRRKNDDIEMFEMVSAKSPLKKRWGFLNKIPFIRGNIALIAASASGAKHLQFASERFDVEPGEEKEEVPSKLELILGVALVGVLSLIFGKILFTALPAFLASVLFQPYVTDLILQNLIEGGIKALLLLGYLYVISRAPVIKRLFEYHGAEHKVINAYEAGKELTVKNVLAQSRLHYRCGSSFIILSIIVGVVVYSFFSYDNVWERMGIRILLLPVVIGISFEALKLTNAVRDIPVLTYLGYPGLWLQKLTTSEPDEAQAEVAIAAFQRMRQLELTAQTDSSSPMNHAG
ncbi:DUF1385 domain-containing protein [Mechercharimyces sp. CAU 1602]|uniref:DUF1385 domain-containing protein n=1 Tax=Mechercharimyces sp. CAU 1602 TaxID=2973933 RepID=UPI0021639AF9|nr:DUF1385 domain-containing protein [Mechercharimyces sp. CAU 1602]MCS1350756.1 DUF1385 domain-containing protein [Mechercharimyces sp. CAU 1602]